jgi:FMN phosphatase YigB (HAD superfamily)
MKDRPTLLVDIGGTLLRRSQPGPYAAAAAALAANGVDVHGRNRIELGRAVLTCADRAAAVETARLRLGLTTGATTALRTALTGSDGSANLLPGSVQLLRTAKDTGWRVLTVSNAAAWSEPLPDELAAYVDEQVGSVSMGLLKQEDGFWPKMLERYGLDSAVAVMIGDSRDGDVDIPRRHGLCAMLSTPGGPELDRLARWIGTAAPIPSDVVGVAAGEVVRWAGQDLIEVPHLSSVVAAVTRFRTRIHLGGGRVISTAVVRRQHAVPALLVPPEVTGGTLLWLTTVIDTRNQRLPEDLATALKSVGLNLSLVPARDSRHLVSLVREATDPQTRRERIDDVIMFLRGVAGRLADD